MASQQTWQMGGQIFYVFVDDNGVAKISGSLLQELLRKAGARPIMAGTVGEASGQANV